MGIPAHHRFDFEDYLGFEEHTGRKHELHGDQIFAMSDGTPEHARVTANIAAILHRALVGRPCAVFSPDLRVTSHAAGLWTYADVTVVCGPPELDPTDRTRQTIMNPKVLVEVLSPSTEEYDRGAKLECYKRIPSVAEVMLVGHARREVEVVRRESDGSWSRHIAGPEEVALLTSIGCELPVAEIYRDPLASSS